MNEWPECSRCGNCFLEINDPEVSLIDAHDFMIWVYNTIDILETRIAEIKGIPTKYYITCCDNVHVSGWIAPKGNKKYIHSQRHHKDLITHVKADLCHFMVKYLLGRDEVSNQTKLTLSTLSLNEVTIFREGMKNQTSYSVIRAGLDCVKIHYTKQV